MQAPRFSLAQHSEGRGASVFGDDVKFRTITADPPWPYDCDGPRAAPSHRPNSWDKVGGSVSSNARYGSMSMDDLLALRPPVEDNAHCYIWTTNSFMQEAHTLMKSWGFETKTILTWIKMKPDGENVSMKSGYYFRGATEHVLFGVRGSLKLQSEDCMPTAFLWPRKPHSKKPDDFRDVVEKCSPGPYLEMFSRPDFGLFGPPDKWTFIGNQSTGRDIAEDIALLAAMEPPK